MTLDECALGKGYIVKSIALDGRIADRLRRLGMTEGVRVVVLSKRRCGAAIVRIRGCRYAIGGRYCRAIGVERTE